MKMKLSYIWIAAWMIVFFIGLKADWKEALSNKGFHLIGNQYYRLFTGLLLHVNWFHLFINASALYWIAGFLDGKVSAVRLFAFSAIVGIMANAVFSMIYKDSTSVGGSPVIFALIALIVVLQLLRKDLPGFHLGTRYGNWTLAYAILGNIPVFSKNISTLVIHLIAFSTAFVLGCAGVKLNIL